MIEQLKQWLLEQIEHDNQFFAIFAEGSDDKIQTKMAEYEHHGSREAYRQVLKFIEGLEK